VGGSVAHAAIPSSAKSEPIACCRRW
jgi:hypothetical protein